MYKAYIMQRLYMYVHRKAGVTACVCGACLPSHAQCMHACSITSTLHAGVWGRHKAIRAGARAEERERGKEKMKMKEGERGGGREGGKINNLLVLLLLL